ncbi:hypothetical protein [Stratiformator vulcanicus]|uniref:Uncharacterized protein n=1 Tax=Stratiformator vulcanicus TaxID=2527980 RepID=A0A517QYE7_9PLAN|nr:hypothetical protein [Stratiformator vulcanicus]QDT36677.1 hypothetical protein Pan189_10390 [Stratiformator vulcanicus]
MSVWTQQNALRYVTEPSHTGGAALSDNFRWLAGNLPAAVSIDGDHNAQPGEFVICDTSAGGLTVTLPDTPLADSRVGVFFDQGTARLTVHAGNGTIVGGGSTITLFVSAEIAGSGDGVALRHLGGGRWLIEHDGRRTHRCRLDRQNPQTLANGVATKIEFDATNFDIGGMADLSGDRIVIQRDSIYSVEIFCAVDGWLGAGTYFILTASATGSRILEKVVVGSATSSWLAGEVATTLPLAAGAVIEMNIFQSSGANRQTSPASFKLPNLVVTELRR